MQSAFVDASLLQVSFQVSKFALRVEKILIGINGLEDTPSEFPPPPPIDARAKA